MDMRSFSWCFLFALGCGATPAGGSATGSCALPTHGPTSHQGSFTEAQTWTADTSPHLIPYDITISAAITLEPCAEVQIAPQVTVTVGVGGSLVGEGTATNPITIGARDAGTAWGDLRAFGGGVRLVNATVSGGGDPQGGPTLFDGMLYGQPGSDPNAVQDSFALIDVTIAGAAGNGIVMSGASFSADSSNLTVTGSVGLFPVSIYPRFVGSLPSGEYTGNTNDEILLPGSGGPEDIDADTTMHDRGVPYHVGHASTAGQLRVGVSSAASPLATLTIEPGVTVRFQKNGYFEVEQFSSSTAAASGALVAQGTAAQPIVFTSAEAMPAPGDWIGLSFGSIPAASDALDHVTVAYAGKATSGGSLSCDSGAADGVAADTGFSEAAISFLGARPAGAVITNSSVLHSAHHGINSGWTGSAIDFTASNTFSDLGGCQVTNPNPGAPGCASVGGVCAFP
jgi:hypothetical protein